MIVRRRFELPKDKEKLLKRAVRLEVASIVALVLISVMMYFAMGTSQAMKTAWAEDLISLVPPILFLVSLYWRKKTPNKNFPYGYRRIMIISFLGASLGLVVLGAILLGDAAMTLIKKEAVYIPDMMIFHNYVWQGWIMITALAVSAIPPVILGHLKVKVAKELHEKTLYADAEMNRADWMTALGGIVGIGGIGLGLWWADAAAAGFISFEILRDGFRNLKNSIADLMDRRPMEVDGKKPLELSEKIATEICKIQGVAKADLRLREDGQVVIGEIFVKTTEGALSPELAEKIKETAKEQDWRIHDLVVYPLGNFNETQGDWFQK